MDVKGTNSVDIMISNDSKVICLVYLKLVCYFIFVLFGHAMGAYGILIPQPGLHPMPLALAAQCPNH